MTDCSICPNPSFSAEELVLSLIEQGFTSCVLEKSSLGLHWWAQEGVRHSSLQGLVVSVVPHAHQSFLVFHLLDALCHHALGDPNIQSMTIQWIKNGRHAATKTTAHETLTMSADQPGAHSLAELLFHYMVRGLYLRPLLPANLSAFSPQVQELMRKLARECLFSKSSSLYEKCYKSWLEFDRQELLSSVTESPKSHPRVM